MSILDIDKHIDVQPITSINLIDSGWKSFSDIAGKCCYGIVYRGDIYLLKDWGSSYELKKFSYDEIVDVYVVKNMDELQMKMI